MLLNDIYNQFYNECAIAKSIIIKSNVFFDNHVNYANELYSSDIHTCVINGAFLKSFKAFEEFLEKSFICYMLGQTGINGKTIISYINPVSIEHAYSIIKWANKYSDFTNRDTIVQLSDKYFKNGGSFTSLNNFNKIFEDIKKIRNAITHVSRDSENKFLEMVRTELGSLPNGCNTANFLNTIETKSKLPYFIYYCEHMKIIVDAIANPS